MSAARAKVSIPSRRGNIATKPRTSAALHTMRQCFPDTCAQSPGMGSPGAFATLRPMAVAPLPSGMSGPPAAVFFFACSLMARSTPAIVPGAAAAAERPL